MEGDKNTTAEADERRRRTGESTRRAVLRSAGVLTGAAVFGGTAGARSSQVEYTKIERVDIESWDGATLACSLYEPKVSDPQPAMLITHGWGGDRHAEVGRAERFAENGYVVLTYDSRGFGESEGEVGHNGPKEVKDASRLVSWLADRASVRNDGPNDPRVGMIGNSYGGYIQLNTAARDDRLDAIVPEIAPYDQVFSYFPNNVVKSGWLSLIYGLGFTSSRGLTSGDGMPDQDDVESGVDKREHEIYAHAAARNELPQHGESYLKLRSPSIKMDEIAASETPALIVQGWPDTLFFPNDGIKLFDQLRARDAEAALILYYGGHTIQAGPQAEVVPPTGDFVDEAKMAWIDEHLRGPGRGNGGQGNEGGGNGGNFDLAPVTMYETQTGEWQSAESIPPSDARPEELRLADALDTGSGATPVANSVAPTATSHFVGPNLDAAGTSIDFDFPVRAPFEVVGAPTLTAYVQPVGPEARLFARVYHVDAGGDAALINNQVTPFRVDSTAETVGVDVEMVAFQRYFRPGDTLRLTIATTDAGFQASRTSAGALVHHSEEHPSSVTLPVVERSQP